MRSNFDFTYTETKAFPWLTLYDPLRLVPNYAAYHVKAKNHKFLSKKVFAYNNTFLAAFRYLSSRSRTERKSVFIWLKTSKAAASLAYMDLPYEP